MAPHDHLVMALVDKRLLYLPPVTSVSGMVETCIAKCRSSYLGHFVLISGYDATQQASRAQLILCSRTMVVTPLPRPRSRPRTTQ